MELELGLGLPSNGNNYYTTAMENQRKKKKNKYPKDGDRHDDQRLVFVDGEEVESKRTTLSLLTWSGQPSDSHGGEKWSNNDDIHRVNDDEEIEGWPPVNNSMRKEMIHHHHYNNNNYYNDNNYNYNNGDENNNNSMRSMYVKVKMEGVPIGRKIDLSQYDSYQSLSTALINMFAKYTDVDAEYRILYQDREGDWMLAGNVPWRSFVESVQRVEILKNETD